MASYLLIESRDPFESRGFAQRSELATALAADGAAVTIFLLENAVLASRSAARVRELDKFAKAGVRVLADEFSLRERGIGSEQIAATVKAVPIGTLVEELVAGAKAIWN
ncbi:MAG TPA: hypothetical protein VE046_13030 [Steroidobacteraceae bacterium]|nr:hypothetical protein [Steroidobacteraceae bacterium]